jgi:hypothetical protein
MNVRVFLDDRWQNTLINVASGKAGLPKVRFFVVVVEVQVRLLGELVVCSSHVPLFRSTWNKCLTFVIPGKNHNGRVMSEPSNILRCLQLYIRKERVVRRVLLPSE